MARTPTPRPGYKFAVHFLKKNMRSQFGKEPAWKVGEERSLPPGLAAQVCRRGYHYFEHFQGAVQTRSMMYGPVVCIVEVPKRAVGASWNKKVGRSRKLIEAFTLDAGTFRRVRYTLDDERAAALLEAITGWVRA